MSFHATGLAFRYPAIWRSVTLSDDVSSFSGLVVALSTGRQHDPCQRAVKPQVTSVSCADPVDGLPARGSPRPVDQQRLPQLARAPGEH